MSRERLPKLSLAVASFPAGCDRESDWVTDLAAPGSGEKSPGDFGWDTDWVPVWGWDASWARGTNRLRGQFLAAGNRDKVPTGTFLPFRRHVQATPANILLMLAKTLVGLDDQQSLYRYRQVLAR